MITKIQESLPTPLAFASLHAVNTKFDSIMSNDANNISAEEALKLLKDGNLRFQSGELKHPHLEKSHREQLLEGQHPYAIILSCADSRVIPELVFDCGLGDLFVIRVAGNVARDKVIGSIEYAVKFLGTKLVVVLGHEKCGAVQAAMGDGEVPGHIGSIVEMIKPAVHIAKTMEGDSFENAIKLNARIVSGSVSGSNPILNDYVKNEGLMVVPGYYEMKSGKVEFL